MPLSASQKDFIALSIDHLLDFSPHEKLLLQQISTLRASILPTLTTTIPNNEFSQLIACLINPQVYLQRLETIGSHGITVAEAQAYILLLIVKNIYALGQQAQIDPQELLSLYSVYNAIPAENKEKIFITQQASFDTGENPNQLTDDAEQIFTGKLRFEEGFSIDEETDEVVISQIAWVDVEIKITTTAPINGKISVMIDDVPLLANDQEEDDYMVELKDYAQLMAEKLAAACAIRILSVNLNLSIEEKAAVIANSYSLLIQRFYFDWVLNNKLDFAFLAALNETEVINLLDKTVMGLLKDGWCDINFASQLYAPQRKVLEVYYSLFKQHRYLIESLDELSEARCQFLIQPPVARLIMQERLSFEEACILPKFLQPLLNDEAYNNFFMAHDIDWDALSRISKRRCKLLLNPALAELILLGKIDINRISDLPFTALKMLAQHSYLAEWLKKDIVTESFILNMASLYIFAYSSRLYLAAKGKPLVVDEIPDSIDRIKDELFTTHHDCHTSTTQLIKEVLWDILVMLKQDLQKIRRNETGNELNADTMALIHQLLTPLECIKIQVDEEPDYHAVFAQMLCVVGNVREQLNTKEYFNPVRPTESNSAFFTTQQVKTNTSRLQKFCVNALKFVPFIEAIEAINKNYPVSRKM